MSTPELIWPHSFERLTIYEDSFENLWRDFVPVKIYYPFTDTFPGLWMVLIFTIIHFVLDRLFDGYAKKFAEKIVNLKKYKSMDWIQQKSDVITKLNKIKDKKEMTLQASTLGLSDKQIKQLKAFNKDNSDFRKNVSKFKEALFKVLVFGFVYLWGIYILCTEGEFFWNQKIIWNQHPQTKTPKLTFYYALQLGYHGHRAIYQFFEHRRSDFWPMFIHHWATWFLLTESWMLGYMQTGAIVMLLLDNTDLLLPLCKLCEYVGFTAGFHFFKIVFLITFIPVRCFAYFYKVFWSILVEGYGLTRRQKENWFGIFLLAVIYILQWYWAWMIVRVVQKLICEKVTVRDTRSDNEDDEEVDVETKKKDN